MVFRVVVIKYINVKIIEIIKEVKCYLEDNDCYFDNRD